MLPFGVTLATATAPRVPGVARSASAPQMGAASISDGRQAYEENCASCHGTDLRGGANAPSIRGAGAAAIDFWVGTGRMPAAVPWLQVEHRGPQIPQRSIDAIVAYVSAVAPGGPPVPVVKAGGDPERGRDPFVQNCAHCHGAAAAGAAIGGVAWAPSLERATLTQIGEAIRIGPGQMPRFGQVQISDREVDDVATYVSRSREHRAESLTTLPLSTSGPVPEGLLGWLAAVVLAVGAYAFFGRAPEGGS